MNSDELMARCSALANELFAIDKKWHTSAVAFIEVGSRILSSFQPYAYARKIEGGDWLRPKGKYMLPFDPQTQRYAVMLFQIRYMVPGLSAQSAHEDHR